MIYNIKAENEIDNYNSWDKVKTFKPIVVKQGVHLYEIIEERERTVTETEEKSISAARRLGNIVLGIFAIIATLGIALLVSPYIRSLFAGKEIIQVANKELVHFAKEIDENDPRGKEVLEVAPAQTMTMLSVPERITLGTYNILFPQAPKPNPPFSTQIGYSVDNEGKIYENSDWRYPLIMDNIKKADLDVVCLQEVVDDTFAKLQKSFKEYNIVWAKHGGKKGPHGVAVMYKKNKFKLLSQKHFDKEVTTEVTNINGDKVEKPKKRVFVMLDIQDKTTQKIFRIQTSHFNDPRGLVNKGQQVEQAVEQALSKSSFSYSLDSKLPST